ncbi:O-antigen ligase family protein [Sporosarcina sp. ANT_H38]|uniref:O-antigen ligase family protein n=1 Tax=Sporosarcina sp. ANT_H38 TaxID=2597358 RepID=UPI0011F1F722|nr:O-antigen ligase family protein [Sporosarcina sp. ANT_H38]KAA0966883.1 O-antigen ligase family protein [Sporosarcina sp. ANT_H38]
MTTIIEKLKDKEIMYFFAALAVIVIALFLPSSIALVVTSLFFALFAFFRPQQSLLFLVIYVSIRPLLVEVNPGLKLIGDLITFIAFAKVIIAGRKDWKSLFSFKWFEWAFFAFLMFGAVSGLVQGVLPSAVIFQLRTFIIMYLLYYTVSRMLLPEGWFQRLAWVTVWTGLIVSVHGIIEKLSMRQLLLPDVWKYKTLSATNFVRIYGLPGNPNSLALLLLFGIIAVLFLQSIYKTEKYKWFLNVNLVLFIGVFILTYSRGTWISAFVLGVIFIILSKNWILMKRLILAGIASILLIYYPVNLGVQYFQTLGLKADPIKPGSISDRFGETFDQSNLALMTESGRFFYIEKGFEVFKDNPVAGAGFGSFGGSATLSYGSPIYKFYGIRSDIYGGKYFYSDNQYIQVIAETGVVGVVLFAAFLLCMLALFWKERKTVFGKFMIAFWFATGVSGFYYNIWELKFYTMFFFIIFGVFASYSNQYVKFKIKDL